MRSGPKPSPRLSQICTHGASRKEESAKGCRETPTRARTGPDHRPNQKTSATRRTHAAGLEGADADGQMQEERPEHREKKISIHGIENGMAPWTSHGSARAWPGPPTGGATALEENRVGLPQKDTQKNKDEKKKHGRSFIPFESTCFLPQNVSDHLQILESGLTVHLLIDEAESNFPVFNVFTGSQKTE